MKKKIFTVMILAIVNAVAMAQITIQPTVSVVGFLQKDQLWNILVVNSSNTNYDCRLKLVLMDRLTGQEIFTATTAQFTLTTGAKQINVNTLNPVQYNYLSGYQNNNLQGLIPAGTYSACYGLSEISAKGVNLAEECINFDAEPLSPPMLIFPSDSSQAETAPAQFSWIPPTPVAMFDRLHYEILITEINQGQKATEAIQENLPFYSEGNLPSNLLGYPGTSPAFEKEKWYAWQVIARDDRQYAGKSNVWVFRIGKEPDDQIMPGDIYLLLKDEKTGTYQLNNRTLHIKYFSPSTSYNGKIIFSNEKGNEVKTDKLKIKQGDNYFDFRLTNRFQPNTPYTLTITDKENKPHTLTFRTN
jgi:hypothetical protein